MSFGNVYAVFLLINGLMYAAMFVRCVTAIIRNGLRKQVRVLMWGAGFYTMWQAHDAFTRFVGRLQQHVLGVVANQSNPGYALFSMGMATLGVLVLAFALEYSAKHGVVQDEPRRRSDDPT